MRNRTAILAVILAIAIIACERNNPPDVSFTHSSESYEEGDTVYFTNTSTEADTYTWYFGDGSSSTDENPFHVFNSVGDLEVTLEASNENGSAEDSQTLTIKSPTILAFNAVNDADNSPLPYTAFLVYDNEVDWTNLENPVAGGYSDINGVFEIYHARNIIYYLYALREAEGGNYFGGGSLPEAVMLNVRTEYDVPLEYIPAEEWKAIQSDLNAVLRKSQNPVQSPPRFRTE